MKKLLLLLVFFGLSVLFAGDVYWEGMAVTSPLYDFSASKNGAYSNKFMKGEFVQVISKQNQKKLTLEIIGTHTLSNVLIVVSPEIASQLALILGDLSEKTLLSDEEINVVQVRREKPDKIEY